MELHGQSQHSPQRPHGDTAPKWKGPGAAGDNNGNSAELYDPATGTWSTTGSLNTARIYQHTATLLKNGKVLVAGGFNNCSSGCVILNSAELYDLTTGTWSSTGNLNTARRAYTATLLPNGKVLVALGANCGPSGGCPASRPLHGGNVQCFG